MQADPRQTPPDPGAPVAAPAPSPRRPAAPIRGGVMSGYLRRSPFVFTIALVLAMGACAPSGASPAPPASGSAPAASESAGASPEESTVTGATCQAGATE